MPDMFKTIDLRVNLTLIIVNSIVVTFCKAEMYFIVLLVLSCLWLCLRGKFIKALKFIIAYVFLSIIANITIGVKALTTIWLFSNIARHLLISIAYTDGITEAATGTLLSVFQKLKLPKSFGISTVVLLRFMPTIRHEFKAIRNSLKFRSVGVGFWNTVLHIPSNFEKTIVPLLLRITRISEELSAAAVVRGVRINNDIISIDEVLFRQSDFLLVIIFSLLSIAVYLTESLILLI